MTKTSRNETIMSAYGDIVRWWQSLDKAERSIFLENVFPAEFSYHSGKIENDDITRHDTKEVFANGRVVSFTGDIRTLFEISNLKNSWSQVLSLAKSKKPLDTDALLSMHKTLTSGTYDDRRWSKGERPGSFKKGDYVVANEIGYSPSDVQPAIESLLREINDTLDTTGKLSAKASLIVSCYAHASIAEIHPFADGNGRTARAMQNLCLIKSGCPPLIVNEKDRMAYYGALDAFHVESNLNSFVEFCAVESIETWKQNLR